MGLWHYYHRNPNAKRDYPRICQQCGKEFSGAHTTLYCPECIVLHYKKWNHKYAIKRSQKLKESRPTCPKCGQPMDYRAHQCHQCFIQELKTRPPEQHPTWRGGRYKTDRGYINTRLQPDSPFYPMANKEGVVGEHRFMMAQHLNRCLTSDEVVHHINGKKGDNRLTNLVLVNRSNHPGQTLLKATQKHVRELENELNQLRTQLPFPNLSQEA